MKPVERKAAAIADGCVIVVLLTIADTDTTKYEMNQIPNLESMKSGQASKLGIGRSRTSN